MRYEFGRKRFSFCVLLIICFLNMSSCCCRKETSCYLELDIHKQIKYEMLIQ